MHFGTISRRQPGSQAAAAAAHGTSAALETLTGAMSRVGVDFWTTSERASDLGRIGPLHLLSSLLFSPLGTLQLSCDKEREGGREFRAARRRPNKVVPLSLTFICPAGRSLALTHTLARPSPG